MRFKFLLIAFLFVFTPKAYPNDNRPNSVVYKKIDTTVLRMDVIYPPAALENNKLYPCMVFFFGGGWNAGKISQFQQYAEYYSKKGMVCFLVDYRVKTRHGTSPFESLKDAKSAIRYIRKNAGDFHINKDSIIASGGSAGGQLAAATALINGYNESADDLTIDAKPNALILFNPVIDNGPGGYGFERIGDVYKNFSPLHNITKGAPPTLILIGTKDHLIPLEAVSYYKRTMEKVGSRCDLHTYEGEGHGFFNEKGFFEKTIIETDRFLVSLGFIKK